jgi:hypothetical protein
MTDGGDGFVFILGGVGGVIDGGAGGVVGGTGGMVFGGAGGVDGSIFEFSISVFSGVRGRIGSIVSNFIIDDVSSSLLSDGSSSVCFSGLFSSFCCPSVFISSFFSKRVINKITFIIFLL